MIEKLKKLKVRFKAHSGCSCSNKNVAYTYILPVRLDKNIVPIMEQFGKNFRQFNKTKMLKIEKPNYTIIGIDKLREIKISFKKVDVNILRRFEEAIAAFVAGKVKNG